MLPAGCMRPNTDGPKGQWNQSNEMIMLAQNPQIGGSGTSSHSKPAGCPLLSWPCCDLVYLRYPLLASGLVYIVTITASEWSCLPCCHCWVSGLIYIVALAGEWACLHCCHCCLFTFLPLLVSWLVYIVVTAGEWTCLHCCHDGGGLVYIIITINKIWIKG